MSITCPLVGAVSVPQSTTVKGSGILSYLQTGGACLLYYNIFRVNYIMLDLEMHIIILYTYPIHTPSHTSNYIPKCQYIMPINYTATICHHISILICIQFPITITSRFAPTPVCILLTCSCDISIENISCVTCIDCCTLVVCST